MDRITYNNNKILPQIEEWVKWYVQRIVATGGNVLSSDSIPVPSVTNLGTVIIYTGSTTGNYTEGHIYECEQNGDSYVWTDLTVTAGIPQATDTVLGGIRAPARDGEAVPVVVDSNTAKLYVGINPFKYTQGTPSTSWAITHNLNGYPAVTVVDSAGSVVIGQVTYSNSNNLIINFSAAFSGIAYLS